MRLWRNLEFTFVPELGDPLDTLVRDAFAVLDDADIELRQVWRALLSNPDIAIAVIRLDDDGELRFVETNAAGQFYATRPWNEVIGHTVRETMIPEVAEFLISKIRLCLTSKESQNYERAIQLPHGRVAWAANLIPVADRHGKVDHAVAMAWPIPLDFHPVGIDLRNKALAEGLCSTSPGLVYLYDSNARRLRFVGGQVESLLGYRPFDLEEMDDPLSHLIHPNDLDRVAAHIAEIVTDPCTKLSVFECSVLGRDGNYRRMLCHNRVSDRNIDGTARTLFGMARDIADQEQLKQEIQSLTDKLSTAQMDERRLIAQEIHDSAGQFIIAAELALLSAQEQNPELSSNKLLTSALGDVMECLKEAEREIRVLSYLWHPPAIGNQALSSVLRNFAFGFGARVGVSMDVRIDKAIDSAPDPLAIPILRICQEALTNVHRHAKATNVLVTLEVCETVIELTIVDDGIGFYASTNAANIGLGIGLSGMRERLEQLGGRLEVQSDRGTTLTAILPLPGPTNSLP